MFRKVKSGGVVQTIKVNDAERLVELDQARSEAFLSRKDFALIAQARGWITEGEAKLWVGGNGIPAWVEAVIDVEVKKPSRLRVKLDVLDDKTVKRMGGLIPLLQKAKGVTDEDLDAVFGIRA